MQNPKSKINALSKTPEGYIAHRHGEPLFVVERCPADMKETHANVIALMPVKRIPHPADVAEMLLAALLRAEQPKPTK
jgi:hypothetical protein